MSMIRNLTGVAVVAALALSVSTSARAQNVPADYTVAKSGVIHLNVAVRAGSEMLQPGMYQLEHRMDGDRHVVAFSEVNMPAGYRHGGTHVAKKPSAQIPCSVEPVATKAKRTTLTFRTNAQGEKEIAEVLIAGESFKHLL